MALFLMTIGIRYIMTKSKTISVSELSDKLDDFEISLTHKDIISSFASRGWGLYECNASLSLYSTFAIQSVLQEIVKMGREKEELEIDVRYILLPLHEKDDDWESVKTLIDLVFENSRGPYYIELKETQNGLFPTARFLIDSVMLHPPYLYLIPDPRLSNVLDESRIKDLQGKMIEIPLTELWKTKQIMMSLRDYNFNKSVN